VTGFFNFTAREFVSIFVTVTVIMSGRKRKNYDPIDPRNSRRTTDNNPKWTKQWVMTENKSSSWCMKNTMDLEVPRGEAKFVLMCINLNYKNNSHPEISRYFKHYYSLKQSNLP
jgi:hypothetical protein